MMSFYHDEEEPLNIDAMIVDETSMVDLQLMMSLLRALKPGCRLILVGDPDQLPSVGAGNVFSDLIRSGKIAAVRLTEIFRQAQQSLIVMNAHAVNRGELPDLSRKDKDFFFMRRRSPEALVQTVQELCAVRLPKNMGIATFRSSRRPGRARPERGRSIWRCRRFSIRRRPESARKSTENFPSARATG